MRLSYILFISAISVLCTRIYFAYFVIPQHSKNVMEWTTDAVVDDFFEILERQHDNDTLTTGLVFEIETDTIIYYLNTKYDTLQYKE